MAAQFRNSLSSPIMNGAAVTPSDSADLPEPAKALWIGGTGAVKIRTYGGDDVTLAAVPVGLLNVPCIRVFSTGTAATNIVALY